MIVLKEHCHDATVSRGLSPMGIALWFDGGYSMWIKAIHFAKHDIFL